MDLLGQLIFSLTKEEKARFSRYSAMLSGSREDHLRNLYQHIISSFRKGKEDWRATLPEPLEKRIDLYASRLMARILESQRERLPAHSVEAKLRALLSDLEFLYRKKHLELCHRKLKQAKKLADELEIESLRLDLLKWEYKLLSISPQTDRIRKFESILQEARESQERLAQQWELRALEEQALKLARTEIRIRNAAAETAFHELLENDLLQGEPSPNTFLPWHTRQFVHGVYHTCKGNYAGAIAFLQPLFEAWEQKPQRIAHEPQQFLRVCNAYLGGLIFSEAHFDELSTLFQRIRQHARLSVEMQLEFEQLSYYQELLFSINYVHGDALRALLDQVGTWLNRNAHQLNPARKTVLIYNLTIGAFCLGDLKLANHWNNQLLQQRKERLDIADFARIFQMILQYEKGDTDLNAYLAQSAYRFFKRTDKLEEFERTIITALQASSGGIPHAEIATLFQEVQDKIKEIAQRPGERNPIGLSIVTVWVQGKIEGRSVNAIMAQNAHDLQQKRTNKPS